MRKLTASIFFFIIWFSLENAQGIVSYRNLSALYVTKSVLVKSLIFPIIEEVGALEDILEHKVKLDREIQELCFFAGKKTNLELYKNLLHFMISDRRIFAPLMPLNKTSYLMNFDLILKSLITPFAVIIEKIADYLTFICTSSKFYKLI